MAAICRDDNTLTPAVAQYGPVSPCKNHHPELALSAIKMASGALNFSLHYSNKRRSIALQIAQGHLTVRAPTGTDIAKINSVIAVKRHWIEQHLQRSALAVKPDWIANGCILLQGNLMALHVQMTTTSAVALADDKVTVSVSTRQSKTSKEDSIRKLLQQWYKQLAMEWCAARVAYWQHQMQLESSAIVIGGWKTKWGYCKSTAELGFNWRLMMAPDWVAEYVVVHELCHLRYLNHSAAFWQLVQQYYPRFAEAKLWLKQHQHQLEL